ncbi:hypothetical protein GEMRC1_006734 [Eukaryota sp. GEM-RC1]
MSSKFSKLVSKSSSFTPRSPKFANVKVFKPFVPRSNVNPSRPCDQGSLHTTLHTHNQSPDGKLESVQEVLKKAHDFLDVLTYSNRMETFSSIVELFRLPLFTNSTQDLSEFNNSFAQLLFDRAIEHPDQIDLYSELCFKISQHFPTFSRIVIIQSQCKFEEFFVAEAVEVLGDDRSLPIVNQFDLNVGGESISKCKSEMSGNLLQFIASLILNTVIPATIASVITKQLVLQFRKPMAIEGLTILWTKLLESAGINEYIEEVVAKNLLKFSNSTEVTAKEQELCIEWMNLYQEKQRSQGESMVKNSTACTTRERSVKGKRALYKECL